MRQLIAILFVFPIVVNAQNEQDSVKISEQTEQSEVKTILNAPVALEQNKAEDHNSYKELKEQYDALRRKYQTASENITKLGQDTASLQREISAYKKKLNSSDKALVSAASNFLYIPYEAYGVEKIALRAFNAINDENLRQKHEIQYELLKNYQTDIRALLSFLQNAKKKWSNPFERKGNGATSLLQEFKQESYYVKYHEYDDWSNTYLGKYIKNIENQFNNNKANFDNIIKDLEACLKTVDDL